MKGLIWLAVAAGCTDPATPVMRSPTAPIAQQGAPLVTSGTWTPLAHQPTFAAGVSLLLTDATVMVQDTGTSAWWKLTPDPTGSYVNGTWSQLASMQTGYSPLYFATAVLPDGRVIVEGGEYINSNPTWTTQGSLYDPIANKWTPVTPPTGWTRIGDASGIILADGTFMVSSCCTKAMATLDLSTMKWTTTGAGKEDINDEESWVLLPNGKIITEDANNPTKLTESEIFDPATGSWTSAGSTVVQIDDLNAMNMGSHEVGPAVLRGDGTVIATGATGHNAIYDSKTGTWSAGPDFPKVGGMQLDIADGPGALLPDDNVLLAASPGVYGSPVHVFEFDGTSMTEVAAPPNAANDSSYLVTMLVLPTGQVMWTDQSGDVQLYTPAGMPKAEYAPVAISIPQPVTATDPDPLLPTPTELTALEPLATLHPGATYKVWLERPNGISQASMYGDDTQQSTNYPIVRLTNMATSHIAFARTHNGSTYAIGQDVVGSTRFDIPATAERGLTQLTIVTNGIPSPSLTVDLK